jgi:beta-lactamase class A
MISSPPHVVLPSIAQVRQARVLARQRSGDVSFAVVDTSGKPHCYRCNERYVAASVVKAMLLIGYLEQLAEDDRPLSSSHRAFLSAMIPRSDNASADAIYLHVGDPGLYRIAAEAGMARFDVRGDWTKARITAADQARLFARIDTLTPAKFRSYTCGLLASVVPSQAWGIPEVSRPRWMTLFKGGWRHTSRGHLVHQVARLERRGLAIAIAVLTDGSPNDGYGRTTIRGIAARLLRP